MLYPNGNGRYQQEYESLWKRLVPRSGQADTVQGELARAIESLGSEWRRNVNMNYDADYRKLTDYLSEKLWNVKVFDALMLGQILDDIEVIRGLGDGSLDRDFVDREDEFDRITDRVVEWCQFHSELIPKPHDPSLHV